ncbi:MAG: Coenzyme F420 hydrogenase/dehydrogenase, beta subunit C-terminal domain [bacterium]
MAEIEIKNSKFYNVFTEVFKKLLSNNIVEAVLVPQEMSGNVVQTLVSESDSLKKINSLAPVLPVNSARIVSKLTIKDFYPVKNNISNERGEKIAVMLRPCEIRALIELVKLKQAKIDNVLVIGIDCFGTYSVNDYVAKNKELNGDGAVTADFIKKVQTNQEIKELRTACQLCRHFVPENSDIAVNLIGTDWNQKIVIQARNEKGKKVLEELKLEDAPENKERKLAVEQEKEKRKKQKGKIEKEDIDFLQVISSLCINCQNCRSVCPICYCKECVFEGEIFEYSKQKYLTWAKRKGLLKMPTDMLLFHLTRMSHVLTSCVACGQCEAACPNKIPLGRIYHHLSNEVQKMLDYEAGRKLDEELPLSAFKEDELQTIES